jgi:peroxiredoxin
MSLNINTSFEKESKLVLKIVAIATVITALSGAYYFFVNNIWKPKVKVLSVDFTNGFATLELPFGRKVDIYGDSQFLIGGDWGVRFGTVMKNGKVSYENIQLLKHGLVDEYLDTTKINN